MVNKEYFTYAEIFEAMQYLREHSISGEEFIKQLTDEQKLLIHLFVTSNMSAEELYVKWINLLEAYEGKQN